jgi:hypothetical protein
MTCEPVEDEDDDEYEPRAPTDILGGKLAMRTSTTIRQKTLALY